MKNKIIGSLLIFMAMGFSLKAQSLPYTPESLPDSIYSGKQGDFHVQGMAIDKVGGYVYLSFTDKLIKLDMQGHLVGSVTGLIGHLGDLAFDPKTGRIYGSLEYKDDAIGKGILKKLGMKPVAGKGVNFYVAIFDSKQITKLNLDASDDKLVRTVSLQTVAADYLAQVKTNNGVQAHRFGCSGMDGITIGPSFGKNKSGKNYLYVAYGIYGDTARSDNDNQVILKYDYTHWWDKYGKKLTQTNPHTVGPEKPLERYFVRTGNTTYGIQNLAYDAFSGNYFAAVYPGKKRGYPNYGLFVMNGHVKPTKGRLVTDGKVQSVKFLSLLDAGLGEQDGVKVDGKFVRGWYFKWGATGLFSLGGGYFYISHNGKSDDGQQQTTLQKYKWVGDATQAFKIIQ